MKSTPQQSPSGNGINMPISPTRIPWQEIFGNHISIVKGHLKMLKMIRMHTPTDSEYWAHVNSMIERTEEMLIMSDNVVRDFVPSSSVAPEIPSSSSPKRQLEDAEPSEPTRTEKKANMTFPPTSPKRKLSDTELTSPSKVSKKTAKAARRKSSASNPDADSPTANNTATAAASSNSAKEKDKSSNEFFFVDTNPTPFNTPAVPTKPSKRRTPPDTEETLISKKSKKTKVEHYSTLPVDPIGAKQVEFEDITAEVDARLKAKEEKRKKVEQEKKRAKELKEFKELDEFMTSKPGKKKPPKEGKATDADSPVDRLTDPSIRKRKRKKSEDASGDEIHTQNPESSFLVPKKKAKNKGNLGEVIKKRTSSSAYEAGDEGDGGKKSTLAAAIADRPKKKMRARKREGAA
ncbi:MAG: hypothetical protein MMC33_004571 [Icmadophila ericetorum]|nr:hypothetical protein [Icmadophila ericetorum]